MSHRLGLVLLFVVACGPSGKPGTTTGNADTRARTCPPAAAVRLAIWENFGEYGGDAYGAPSTAHWQVPLRVFPPTYDDSYQPTSTPQTPGPRTEAEVRAMFDGPLGDDAWVYVGGAAQACRGRVVGYYLTHVIGDAAPFDLLAAQVEGCPRTDGLWEPSFAVLGVEPTGCALATPEVVAVRDGSYQAIDPDEPEQFVMPTGPDQLPAEIAGVIVPPACETPPCRPVWQIRRAGTPGTYVYDVSVMWLSPQLDDHECNWTTSTTRALYLGGDVAVSKAPIMVDGVNWDTGEPARQEAMVNLAGVLHDAGGARLVLTTAPGQYGVHELDGTRLGAGALHDWYVPHDEDHLQPLVGPSCGL